MNKYHHIYHRVEYPSERGYRMEPEPLPDWIYLTVVESGTSKQLTVHSRIHENKEVKLNPSYSSDFSDQNIIQELSAEIGRRFL